MAKKKDLPAYMKPGHTMGNPVTYEMDEARRRPAPEIREKNENKGIYKGDGTSISRQKAPQKEYRYGRGGRQTTTSLRVAERGKIDPATYMPSGKSGSLKVQSMQKKKRQQTTNSAVNGAAASAYEKAFGKKKR